MEHKYKSSVLPKHPNQQRREMKNTSVLSVLCRTSGPVALSKHPHKITRNIQDCRSGLDSLSLAVESDDDDENYIRRKPTIYASKLQLTNQTKSVIGHSQKNQQSNVRKTTESMWSGSSLLTGLSLNKGNNSKQNAVNRKAPLVDRTLTNNNNKISSRRLIKSTDCTSKPPLRDGLLSFLCNHSDTDGDGDDERMHHCMKRNTKKVPPKNVNPYMVGSSRDNVRAEAPSGYALQRAYEVAGRTYRPQTTNRSVKQSRQLKPFQESDLYLTATTQRNEDDSDASSNQNGNLLSLFQSKMTISRPNPVSSKLLASSYARSKTSTTLSFVPTDIGNSLRSKRSVFTSPIPKVNRQHKRCDQKKTPTMKSEIFEPDHLKGMLFDQSKTKHMVEIVMQNNDNKELVYVDDDETASSLSDESISKTCRHTLLMSNQKFTRGDSISPLSVAEKTEILNSNPNTLSLCEPIDDIVVGDETSMKLSDNLDHTMSLPVEVININSDTLSLSDPIDNIVVGDETSADLSDNLDHNMSPFDGICDAEQSKEYSTCQDQMHTSEQDVKLVRRSHRARTVTNRFTVVPVDSDRLHTKVKKMKNRQTHESVPVPEQKVYEPDCTVELKCVNSKSRTEPSNVPDNNSMKVQIPSVVNAGRPQRERKKTDFYHDHIAWEDIIYHTNTAAVSTVENTTTTLPIPISTHTDLHIIHSTKIADVTTTKVAFRPPCIVPKVVNIYTVSPSIDTSWSNEQLQQLRDAQEEVDPTSVTFWLDVAAIVQGRSSSECQLQWYSMAKTPIPKFKPLPVIPLPSAMDDDEDDIFQSTPMRRNVLTNSNFYQIFDTVNMPMLPTPTISSLTDDDEMIATSHETIAPNVKPVSKAFLQRMKRNFARAETNFVAKAKADQHRGYSGKNTKALTEVLRDHDMDINIRLTPGGTLKVKSHIDNDEDDFWDDEYDADEENDYRANFC